MFPLDILASIGFENDIRYICIWGTMNEFLPKDRNGFIYVLPSANFKKIGKEYEWQSFESVNPEEIEEFTSVIDGMIENGVQVYFVNNNDIFDRIVAEKDNRMPILIHLVSENQKRNTNIKLFE